MYSRIQTLEDEVKILKEAMRGGEEEQTSELSENGKISTADIRNYIEKRKQKALESGNDELTLLASEIHNSMGLNNKYPMVCNAMRQCMGKSDIIIHETASGYSSSLEIRYFLDDQLQ